MAKNIILQDPAKASVEQLRMNIENIKAEFPKYEKHHEHTRGLIETNKKRLSLMERMSAISDNKCRALNPSFEFQQDDEWVGLQSELLKLNSAKEREAVQLEIDRLTEQDESFQAELQRFKEALPLYEAELAKREVN